MAELGERGCWLESSGFEGMIPIEPRKVVDITGAEDAFASDCIASRPRSADGCPQDRLAGHRAAAKMVTPLGVAAGWFL
ncbi:MAG: hypothetical protein WCX84_03525 [Syntrophales bacterium]|nr:hypothetical protein [Syntrophales bacterium]